MRVRGKPPAAGPRAGSARGGMPPAVPRVGARIDARRRVRLEIHASPSARRGRSVETDLEEIGGRGVARDVAAQLARAAVGAHHHGERVPAHQRRQPRLDLEVALVRGLLVQADRVHVGRRENLRQRHAAHSRVLQQPPQQEGRAVLALGGDERVQRLDPLPGLEGIGVPLLGRRRGVRAHFLPEAAARIASRVVLGVIACGSIAHLDHRRLAGSHAPLEGRAELRRLLQDLPGRAEGAREAAKCGFTRSVPHTRPG